MQRENELMEWGKKHRYIVYLLIVYIGLISAVLFEQGVMCNDEALYQLYARSGIKNFFRYFTYVQAYCKGRFLSAIPTTFFIYLGYANPAHWYVRGIAILVLFSSIVIFAKFLYEVFENINLSIVFILLSWGYMPITFEPSAPNAYVTLFGIPFILLIISLIMYVRGLKQNNKKNMIISSLLFFVPLCSYEIFITYTPLFLLLAYYYTKESDFYLRIRGTINKFIYPFCSAIVFLILYIATGRVFQTQYDGTKILFTIKGALKIIKQLFASSIPGYFLLNGKYQFLFKYYCENKSDLFFKSLLKNLDIRVLVIAFIFMIVVINARKQKTKNKTHNGLVIVVGIIFALLPLTPLAISEMYQDNVTSTNFTELPVCYFTNYAICFCISYVICVIGLKKCPTWIKNLLLVFLVILLISIQVMNTTIAKEQKKNYQRFSAIENVLNTYLFQNINGSIIYSEDIFETKNMLAINDAYWDVYMQNKGLSFNFTKEKDNAAWKFYFENDEYFVLENGKEYFVLIPEDNHREWVYIETSEGILKKDAKNEAAVKNAGFRIYRYSIYE